MEESLGEDGRILLRASGTEPLIRVMVEASKEELCEKYVEEVIAVMKKEGLVLPRIIDRVKGSPAELGKFVWQYRVDSK